MEELDGAALHGGLSIDAWEVARGDGQAEARTARDGDGSSQRRLKTENARGCPTRSAGMVHPRRG